MKTQIIPKIANLSPASKSLSSISANLVHAQLEMRLINILIVSIVTLIEMTATYRFSVFEKDHADLCNGQKCGDLKHTACHPVDEIAPQCKKFEKMMITRQHIREIILGHNGLRNRVAKDYFYPASNMNLLHWDKDLAWLAELWVNQCRMDYDECDFLCKYIVLWLIFN